MSATNMLVDTDMLDKHGCKTSFKNFIEFEDKKFLIDSTLKYVSSIRWHVSLNRKEQGNGKY